KQAIDAGVTAYIVDGIDPARLHTILEISIEQYKKHLCTRQISQNPYPIRILPS
ncbi:hypothetical protein J484_4003, partial [Acinetobacter baumannii 1051830]